MIANRNGIDLVVNVIRTHPKQVSLVEHAVSVLKSLAVNDDNEVAIVKAGGIELVLTVMESFLSTASLQEQVKRASTGYLGNYSEFCLLLLSSVVEH